jgi:hypothetical protein
MSYKINSIDEYKLYIKSQLSKVIKDEKKLNILVDEEKLNILVDEYYIAFCDGVRFGQGNLRVEL